MSEPTKPPSIRKRYGRLASKFLASIRTGRYSESQALERHGATRADLRAWMREPGFPEEYLRAQRGEGRARIWDLNAIPTGPDGGGSGEALGRGYLATLATARRRRDPSLEREVIYEIERRTGKHVEPRVPLGSGPEIELTDHAGPLWAWIRRRAAQ